jgi:hypothetical protein
MKILQKKYLPTQLIFLLFISITSFGQTTPAKNRNLLTSKYAGQYEYGHNVEKERIGYLLIFPESDSTVLFYMDLNRGAPSYNMGSLYGRIKIFNDTATFFTKFDSLGKGCEFSFHFTSIKIDIITINGRDDCYFGYGVYADGHFKKKSNKINEYFENAEGRKIYFNKIRPEDYYKND